MTQMGVPQFQSDEPLRAQRMTADEAASVIALWQQEQSEHTGMTDKPAVPDVAEGLDIAVEDVQRLLQDVRIRQTEEARLLAQEQELAEAQRRLAEEERRLAEIHRQRTELEREQAYQQGNTTPHSRWVEVRPNVWEESEQKSNQEIPSLGLWLAKLAKVIFLCLLLGLFIGPVIYVIILWIFSVAH